MHGPNKTPTEISRMLAVGLDCYTVVDHFEQVRQIRTVRPNGVILIRPYFTGGLAVDPVETAQRACDHMVQYLDVTKHLVIGNEPNIEGPFDAMEPNSWKGLNNWVLRTAEVVRRNLPEVVLHFPAVSPGVGDDPDILNPPGLEYCREAVEECDVLDQHVYFPGRSAPAWAYEQRFEPWYGRRMLWHHRLFPNKWIYLSECGPNDVRPVGTGEDIIAFFRILEVEFPYWFGGALYQWNWGKGNDHLNYYDKGYVTEPLRMAPKKLFEMPTSWVYDEDTPEPEPEPGEWQPRTVRGTVRATIGGLEFDVGVAGQIELGPEAGYTR